MQDVPLHLLVHSPPRRPQAARPARQPASSERLAGSGVAGAFVPLTVMVAKSLARSKSSTVMVVLLATPKASPLEPTFTVAVPNPVPLTVKPYRAAAWVASSVALVA